MRQSILVLCMVLGSSAVGYGATWDIDKSHSHIGFKVRHLVISKVRGTFNQFKGTVSFDDSNIETLKTELEIDVASIDTGDAKRDKHLRSADFFDAKNHPKMIFKSTRVKKAGKGKLEVFGTLSMKGVTKPVMLQVEGPSPEVKDPGGNPHRAFYIELTINRKEWGMMWDKSVEGTGAVVGDEIEIEIEIELKNKR
jgi:polyisoprenoid-binding protein YceI